MKMGNNLGRFKSDVQEYKDLSQKVNSEYQNLKEQIDLLNTMWTGDAHDALITEFKKDDEQVQQMLSYLKKVEKNLDTALKAYTDCENQAGEMIQSL